MVPAWVQDGWYLNFSSRSFHVSSGQIKASFTQMDSGKRWCSTAAVARKPIQTNYRLTDVAAH